MWLTVRIQWKICRKIFTIRLNGPIEFLPVEVKLALLLTFGGDVLSVGLLDTKGVLKLVIDIVLVIDDGVINGEFINESTIDEVKEGVIDEE